MSLFVIRKPEKISVKLCLIFRISFISYITNGLSLSQQERSPGVMKPILPLFFSFSFWTYKANKQTNKTKITHRDLSYLEYYNFTTY